MVKITANIPNLKYNVCADGILRAAEPFVTKLGVEIHHHKLERHAEKKGYYFKFKAGFV